MDNSGEKVCSYVKAGKTVKVCVYIKLSLMKKAKPVNQRLTGFGWYRRDGRIRTCGLHIPNVARYRATLHPDWGLQKYDFKLLFQIFLKKKFSRLDNPLIHKFLIEWLSFVFIKACRVFSE